MSNLISGRALAGATVVLSQSGTILSTVTAGPTGSYSFTGLAAGTYTVTPSKAGYAFVPVSQNETIVATDITGVNFLATSVGTQASTYTIQFVMDKVKALPEIEPILAVGGYEDEPMVSACNDVMTAICGTPFPHKWNRGYLPLFYTWSWQQDYALVNPDFSSVYQFEWLEGGVAINISSSQIPKPWVRVECGRDLPQRTGTYMINGGTELGDPGFMVAWFPNSELYYGTWGAPQVNNQSWGNNPQPGSFYMGPLGVFVEAATWAATSGGQATFTLNQLPQGIQAGSVLQITGATPAGYNGSWIVVSVPGSAVANPQVVVTMTTNPGTYQAGGAQPNTGQAMAPNPINQIVDANGNLLVLTTFGTEGTTAPLASVGATPGTQVSGTGASTIWTVVDPVGMGVRILNVPSQTGIVWQFNIKAQFVPIKFTNLTNVLAPLPDKFEPYFRQGVIAQLYRYSPKASVSKKFEIEWANWTRSLDGMRINEDRELEEYSFLPERTVMGQGRSRNTFRGAAWPFPYPVVN